MKVPADSLRNKLQHLSISQPSIETVAGFCVFYHKDAAGVVSVWNEEFAKAPNDRRLALLYLANHVLQEGRKKGSAYPAAFMGVLPRAMARLASSGDEKSQRAVTRLVSVWEERRVFGSTQLAALREAVGGGAAAAGGDDQPAAARGGTKPSSNKKAAGAGGGKGSNGAARSGGSSSSGAAAARLGPVGDALTAALDAAAEAAACGRAFTASWAQGLLERGGPPEVAAAQGLLAEYEAALGREAAARQAALAALVAEQASQAAELSRVQQQATDAAERKTQLEARLANLSSQLVASLLHELNGDPGAALAAVMSTSGLAAAAAAVAADSTSAVAAAADVSGSPQAPELLNAEGSEDAPSIAAAMAAAEAADGDTAATAAAAALPEAAGTAAEDNDGELQLQALIADAADANANAHAADAVMDSTAAPLDGGQDDVGAAAAAGLQTHDGFADEADEPYDPEAE